MEVTEDGTHSVMLRIARGVRLGILLGCWLCDWDLLMLLSQGLADASALDIWLVDSDGLAIIAAFRSWEILSVALEVVSEWLSASSLLVGKKLTFASLRLLHRKQGL